MELKEQIKQTSASSRVSKNTLENFVSQKFHWESLTPSDVMKIAIELTALRQIMGESDEY